MKIPLASSFHLSLIVLRCPYGGALYMARIRQSWGLFLKDFVQLSFNFDWICVLWPICLPTLEMSPFHLSVSSIQSMHPTSLPCLFVSSSQLPYEPPPPSLPWPMFLLFCNIPFHVSFYLSLCMVSVIFCFLSLPCAVICLRRVYSFLSLTCMQFPAFGTYRTVCVVLSVSTVRLLSIMSSVSL